MYNLMEVELSFIDGNSSLYLYEQLYRILKEKICRGEFKANHKIPSEYELSKTYKINRHTVRKAIEKMRNEGFIYTIKGKGTFVSVNKISYKVSKKTRFTESILNLGFNPDAKILESYEIYPEKIISKKLGIEPSRKIIVLEILRYVDNIPFCYTKSFLDSERFKDINKHIKGFFSLYQIFESIYNIQPVRLSSEFEVTLPDSYEMKVLGISNKTPLLVVKSLSADFKQIPIEYCITKFRGDICSIYLDFQNKGGDNHKENPKTRNLDCIHLTLNSKSI